MKIYLAATSIDEVIEKNWVFYLFSFHYFKKKLSSLENIKRDKNIFIDSGAFSADNSGVEINIDEYCEFLIKLSPNMYAGLDVIGNAEESKKNNIYMKERYGLKPIPTFHMKEHERYLYEMISSYDYIALGGMVKSGNIEVWLDGVWNIIMKENPLLKVHGFAMTDPINMLRYPWYSVDSSSWTWAFRYGLVYLFNNGKWLTISLNEAYDNLGMAYHRDPPPTKEEIYKVLKYQINQYVKMEEWINSHNIDYNYITAQQTLF